MNRIALIGLLALLASACLGSDFADSVEGPWQMISGTVNGEQIPLLDSHPITANFEDGQVGGTAACNSYGGTYSLSGSTISIGDLAMTEMACFPEEVMRAEALFSEGIMRVDTVTLNGGLTLSGDDVEMVFEALEPVPDRGLTGITWVLDGLIQGDAVSTPWPTPTGLSSYPTMDPCAGTPGADPSRVSTSSTVLRCSQPSWPQMDTSANQV
jgi:heat shock protein HslJ